jgi:hypothetical protein
LCVCSCCLGDRVVGSSGARLWTSVGVRATSLVWSSSVDWVAEPTTCLVCGLGGAYVPVFVWFSVINQATFFLIKLTGKPDFFHFHLTCTLLVAAAKWQGCSSAADQVQVVREPCPATQRVILRAEVGSGRTPYRGGHRRVRDRAGLHERARPMEPGAG